MNRAIRKRLVDAGHIRPASSAARPRPGVVMIDLMALKSRRSEFRAILPEPPREIRVTSEEYLSQFPDPTDVEEMMNA